MLIRSAWGVLVAAIRVRRARKRQDPERFEWRCSQCGEPGSESDLFCSCLEGV